LYGHHEKEDNDEQFYSTMQSKRKFKKLTKGGRVQSIPGNIGNGRGIMVLEMELCMLLLETLDTRVLGPPKMQEGEEGLQALEWGW
jgi:hypothetical protein